MQRRIFLGGVKVDKKTVKIYFCVISRHGPCLLYTSDTPKNVFSHVEQLKSVGLDVPQSTELVYELKKAGYPVDSHIIDEEECVEQILRLLEE